MRQNVALSQTPIIPVELVQQSLGGTTGRMVSFDEARDEFTRSYLSQILQITGGNVSQAARLAKRNRTDFYKRLGRHQLTPEDFKAPFTAAEGWGSFSQIRTDKTQTNRIALKWGGLRVKTLAFELPPAATLSAATVAVGAKQIPAKAIQTGQRVELTLDEAISLQAAQSIESKLAFV